MWQGSEQQTHRVSSLPIHNIRGSSKVLYVLRTNLYSAAVHTREQIKGMLKISCLLRSTKCEICNWIFFERRPLLASGFHLFQASCTLVRTSLQPESIRTERKTS